MRITTANFAAKAEISPVELANLAAHLVASGMVTASPPAPGDRPQSRMQWAIEETLAFIDLCSEALSTRTKGGDHASAALAIAASANRIRSSAYEAFDNSPPPTAEALERIGEHRVWEGLSRESQSEARKKLARAPIGEFLREANIGALSPTQSELESIGETRAWNSIPVSEQSNSIFRILTNHMIELGDDQIPALNDATISEYGAEGIPVELAEGILWHLKLSSEDRQASSEKEKTSGTVLEATPDEAAGEGDESPTGKTQETTAS